MGYARLTDTDNNVVFDFPTEPSYISPFPEGGEQRVEGEYVLSVDENGDYVAGGKTVKFLPTTDVGKKITIAGNILQTDAEDINDMYKGAKVLRFEALRCQKTYDYYVQMAEPKWTPTGSIDNLGVENLQYTIDLYIQYT